MSISSQITMAWNGHELLVEAANPTTGAREKLAVSMSDLPYEMQVILKDNLRKAQGKAEQLSHAAKMREERFQETRAREAQAAVEAEARWTKYLSDLAPHIVAYHEHKKALRLAKSLETSKQIYGHIATTPGQGVEFADKVIEPSRRPRRIEMTQNGNKVTYYPRTGDNKTTKAAKKAAGIVGRLDVSGFSFNKSA